MRFRRRSQVLYTETFVEVHPHQLSLAIFILLELKLWLPSNAVSLEIEYLCNWT